MLHELLTDIRGEIQAIATGGCAKREGDMIRVERVESDVMETNKAIRSIRKDLRSIYYACLVIAGGIIASLVTRAALPYIGAGP